MSWKIEFTKQVRKDSENLTGALRENAKHLLGILGANPFQDPPPYEKLRGDLAGSYSRRINQQHRLVYDVHQEESLVVVLSMWGHY